MSLSVFDADRSRSEAGVEARSLTVLDASDLFGDPLTKALYREDAYAVPADQRLTCPLHLDWRADCLDLHVGRPAVVRAAA